MKKRPLILIATIFALLQGCTKEDVNQNKATENGKSKADIQKIHKPKETITLERAHLLYKTYQERYKSLTVMRHGKKDAIYGWHSIDFYKNYFSYLEQTAEKMNIEISGLRLYYAAYPENDEKSGEQRGYQTYMFVPTYYDLKTNKHIAFDPLYLDKQGNPLPIHDIIKRGFQNDNTAALSEHESSIVNMAQMCTPNCPEE